MQEEDAQRADDLVRASTLYRGDDLWSRQCKMQASGWNHVIEIRKAGQMMRFGG